MDLVSPDTMMSFLRRLDRLDLEKYINGLSPEAYDNLVKSVGSDQLHELLNPPLMFDYFPPELNSIIMSHISTPEEIIKLFSIHNKKLYEYLSREIRQVDYGSPLPIGMVHRLRNVETINIHLIINGELPSELIKQGQAIATLPHLKKATVVYLPHLEYTDMLQCFSNFVNDYSRGTYYLNLNGEIYENINNRDFSQSNIDLYFTIKTSKFPPDDLNIKLSPMPYLLEPSSKTHHIFFNHTSSRDILDVYRKYNLLPAFDLSFVGDWKYMNDSFVQYLREIPELKYLSIPYEYLRDAEEIRWAYDNLGILINMLGDKIEGLYIRGHDSMYITIVEDYQGLNITPNEKMKIFNLPVYIDYLRSVLNIYPNIEEIFIIAPHPTRQIIDYLLSYTQLKVININTPPQYYYLLTSHRFRKVLGYFSYLNM